MIETPFEVPEEIRERVAQKLKNSGALKQIASSIKIGMTAAIHELRDHPDAKSSLELARFDHSPEPEIAALQAIYQYLDERGMTYTLGCLIEEARVEKEDDAFDLIDVVGGQDDDAEADEFNED